MSVSFALRSMFRRRHAEAIRAFTPLPSAMLPLPMMPIAAFITLIDTLLPILSAVTPLRRLLPMFTPDARYAL